MKTSFHPKNFPIVCVVDSAGGLEAYIHLLKNLPADLGVAIIIVNHLRTVATILHKILPRFATMKVVLLREKLDIQPNHVYIIPEKRDLQIFKGDFRLKPISRPTEWPDLMHSLKHNWDGKVIAVTVSANDGDGVEALQGITKAGGIISQLLNRTIGYQRKINHTLSF